MKVLVIDHIFGNEKPKSCKLSVKKSTSSNSEIVGLE